MNSLSVYIHTSDDLRHLLFVLLDSGRAVDEVEFRSRFFDEIMNRVEGLIRKLEISGYKVFVSPRSSGRVVTKAFLARGIVVSPIRGYDPLRQADWTVAQEMIAKARTHGQN